MKLDPLLQQGVAPIVAILRGLRPAEAVDLGRALVTAGVRIIEVPLNSPKPLQSIALLQQTFGADALIGAGTVLAASEVEAVAKTGAGFIVTPNTDPAVISHAVALGLEPMPGFFTASEAFAALRAGATRLKLFPASSADAGHVKALRDVLPSETQIWAVGGTSAGNFVQWLERGVTGIGVGGSLYKPGDPATLVGERARALVAAWNARSVKS
jgi:2-dehydro-3-deoxyphosphogalactonate aldolase